MVLLCHLVLIAGLTFGGGSRPGLVGDVVVQVLAIGLMLACVKAWLDGRRARITALEAFLLAVGPVIAVLQMVPLPPLLWGFLPRLDLRLAPFESLGVSPDWLPLSLDPAATGLAAIALLPPIALFVGVRHLKRSDQRSLLLVAIGVIAIGTILGLMQLAGGPGSILRFYAVTNTDDAVGFFANRNHFAASLYVGILFAAPLLIESLIGFFDARRARGVGAEHLVVLFGTATVILLFGAGLVMARSRAGVALAAVAAIAVALLLVLRPNNRWRGIGVLLVLGIIGGVAAFAADAGLDRLLDRVVLDARADERLAIARNTLAALADFLPSGSGFGTFPKVYALYEGTEDLQPNVYVNAAHDDWLQLLLEAGAPALAIMLAVIGWIGSRSVWLFRRPDLSGGHLDLTIRRALLIAVMLLALHSFVDYPLRTAGGMELLALAAALVGAPRRRARGPERPEAEVMVR